MVSRVPTAGVQQNGKAAGAEVSQAPGQVGRLHKLTGILGGRKESRAGGCGSSSAQKPTALWGLTTRRAFLPDPAHQLPPSILRAAEVT